MRFRDDQRGVTVQVGAVLLLGIIVISLSIYQVQVVPAQNEQVEFDHSQAVQTDLQETRNALLRTATTGGSQPTTVRLGARYPARAVFVNPPPVSGSIRTTDDGLFAVDNARAVNPETRDYWNATERTFDTGRLVYTPDYAVYDNGPTTTYANSVVYNRFGSDRSVTLSDQRLVDGNAVTLVALDGDLSASRTDAVSVDAHAVSASTRTVAVENDGGPLTINVSTELSEETWADLLADERVAAGGNVSGVTVERGNLSLELEPGVYTLRLAEVGVGTNAGTTNATYLTTVDAPETTTPGTTQQFTVEVRDRYDNPVSGVPVSTAQSDRVDPVGRPISDEEGRVTFAYTAPGSPTTDRIDLSYYDPTRTGFGPDKPQDVSYTVDVASAGGGGGGASRTDIQVSDFEGGDLGSAGWTLDRGSGGVASDTSNSGNEAAYVGGDAADGSIIKTAVDTSGYDRVEVGYWLREGDGSAGPEAYDENGPEEVVVEYRNADAEWIELDRFNVTGNFTRYERTHGLGLESTLHSDFVLRFRQLGGDADGDRWYVDDVRIVGVTNSRGGSSNSAPTTSFVYTPSSPTAGESIEFNGGSSSDSDGSVASYDWDWTNDGTYEGSGKIASHTYSSSGTYTVKLRVTDDDGATSTTTQQVDVSSAGNNPPSASFSFSPSGPAADEEVTFDASGTTDDGSISGYQWDWTNDGTTDDTGQQAQHRYSSSGTYDVKLTVKDDDGATDTTTQTVTVQTTGLSAIEGSPNRAFDDANGNGRLDNGETTYSKGQIADFDDESANLVIPENIKKINKNQIEIEAASVNSEADLVSKSGDVQVEASGDIRLRGEVQAQNGNVELSGNRIDTSGVSIRSSTGNVEITASSVFDASDGRLDSQNGDVELISDGDMTLSGATVSSGTGSLSAELGGPNTLYVSGTTIQEPNGDGVLRYSPGSVVEAPDRSEVGPR